MATQFLDVAIRFKQAGIGALQDAQKQIEGTTKAFNNLNPAVQAAIGALQAYAGTRGLLSIIRGAEDSIKAQVQAKFFLRGFTTDVDSALGVINKYGRALQLSSGIPSEEFAVVTAKLTNRVRDVNKAISFSNTLFKAQRIGLFNATDASNLFLRASEGNTRALRFLLEQVGIAVPEFSSLENIFAILEKRMQGLESELGPFATQWAALKELFLDLTKGPGAELAKFFGFILEGIKLFLEAHPALKSFIGSFITFGSVVLALVGIFFLLKPVILGAIGLLGGPATIAVLAFMALIAGLSFILDKFGLTWTDVFNFIKNIVVNTFTFIFNVISTVINAIVNFLTPILQFIGTVFMFTLQFIVGLFVITFGAIWNVVQSTFNAIWNFLRPILVLISGFIKDKFNEALEFLKLIFAPFLPFFTEFWEGMKKLFDESTSKIKSILEKFAEGAAKVLNPVIELMNKVIELANRVAEAGAKALGATAIRIPTIPLVNRQFGGPVQGGRPFIVGEAGPELFVPETAGRIVPRGGLAGVGGGINIVITGNTFMSDERTATEIGDMILKRVKLLTRFGID